jgi:hypothetical protein
MFDQRQGLSGDIPGDPEGGGDMNNVLAVLAVLAMVPCLMLAGSLNGTVVDRSTSQPIADALVTLHVLLPDSIAYPDTSGASGEYSIDGIVTGNEIYVIMAGKPGYKPYYFRYDTVGAGSYTFDIVLEPDTASSGGGGGDSTEVSGQVFGRDRVSGVLTPLTGAEVRLVSGAQEWNVVTGSQGRFGSLLPSGSYAVTVSAPGYGPESSGGVFVGEDGLTYGTILVSSVTDVSLDKLPPSRFQLLGAYPNPFNPGTNVRFSVPNLMPVRLTVHNILGQELATVLEATLPAGSHTVYFNADGLAGGIYFLRLRAGNNVATARAILTR